MIERATRGIGRTLVLLLLLLGLTAAHAQEMVVNGNFARGGDPPPGWVRDRDTARKGTIRVVDGMLEMAPTPANTPGSAKPLGLGQAIDAGNLAGKTLRLSARVAMRTPATGAVVGLHALRADGSEIGMVHLRPSRADAPLEPVQGTLAIPAGERPKLLILIAVAEGEGGQALFDSISVREAGATPLARDAQSQPIAPGAVAAPATANAAGYAARVSVDAGARLREIPRTLYGVNIEWWRDANNLWDTAADRPRADLQALTRTLNPTLIRFPGGFLGDTYNWRQAVGKRNLRPAQVSNPDSGEKSVPLFGTDEVLQFAHDVGADVLMTANMGSGNAKLAADWVRYTDEARRRNPDGGKVLAWEIGNEVYHKGGTGGSLGPEEYSDKLREFAREMRAVDPAVRIGAVGLENYPTFPFNSYRNWNAIVLARTGADIDFFAVHNGYAPVAPDDGANPRDVYQALWAAPLMVADNLRTTGEQIRKYAPAGRGERIKIAVTEWAPLFHVAPSSAWIDHSKTLGSALFVADMLRMFIADPKVEMATFFKLNEPSFLGLLGARGGNWIPNATYYAFELYTRHFGSTAVSARAQAPTYDSVKEGIVPAMRGVPMLETSASVSADGSVLYVMLINKSWDQAVNVELSIAGFEPRAGAAWLLTGASADSNTGAELPKVPGLKWARQVNVDSTHEFDRGDPSRISFGSTPLAEAGRQMRYRLPAHSVASLELRRR